jgi:molybdopterin biosynthesis enzyme
VAIRPGKPILFAQVPSEDEKSFVPVFGMPGNPVSTTVALEFFVKPFLRRFFGLKTEAVTTAKVQSSVRKPEGLRCFFKAKIQREKGESQIEILAKQGSYLVGNFGSVNSWAILPETSEAGEVGSVVEYCEMNGGL